MEETCSEIMGKIHRIWATRMTNAEVINALNRDYPERPKLCPHTLDLFKKGVGNENSS